MVHVGVSNLCNNEPVGNLPRGTVLIEKCIGHMLNKRLQNNNSRHCNRSLMIFCAPSRNQDENENYIEVWPDRASRFIASSLLNFEEVVIPVFDIDVLMMSLLDRKDRGLDEMVVLGE